MKSKLIKAVSGITAATLIASTALTASASYASAATNGAPSSAHPITTNGVYYFTNAATGKNIDVTGEPIGPQTVRQAAPTAYTGQNVQLHALQDGTVQLSSPKTGLCFTPDGTDLIVTAPCGADNQRFVVSLVNNKLVFRSVGTQKVLSSATATANNGDQLKLTTADYSAQQGWQASPGNQNRIAVEGRANANGGQAFAANTTIRMQAHMSAGGQAPRLTYSNKYGTQPLVIGAATVALQASGSTPTAAPVAVTFGGLRAVTIPVGAEVTSDPALAINVTAGENLLTSIYLPSAVPVSTFHKMALNTTYIAESGNQTDSTNPASFTSTSGSTYFLKGVDLISMSTRKSLVAIGDSITDGYNSNFDLNKRWVDILSERLRASGDPATSIVNAGISGNRAESSTNDSEGESGVTRFDTDVVRREGTTGVLIFEGVNDIKRGATAADTIAALAHMVSQARNADLAVNIATIEPMYLCGAAASTNENARQEVNAWIRANSIGADYVVDFDAAVRNPSNPACWDPAYDTGDGLHPNQNGSQRMADTFDLALLKY